MQSEYLNYANGQFIQDTKINHSIQVKSMQKGSDVQASKYTALSTWNTEDMRSKHFNCGNSASKNI